MAAETRVCRWARYSAPVGIRLVRTDSDRARISEPRTTRTTRGRLSAALFEVSIKTNI
jgi:hypothetical protein